jgi:hypothetical protein
VVEHLPSKHEVLSSTPSNSKKTKQQKSVCLTDPVNKEKEKPHAPHAPHAFISVVTEKKKLGQSIKT